MTYHVPPALLFLSNTLISSKDCSLMSASVAMAPAGPAPMTATRRIFCAPILALVNYDVSRRQKMVRQIIDHSIDVDLSQLPRKMLTSEIHLGAADLRGLPAHNIGR